MNTWSLSYRERYWGRCPYNTNTIFRTGDYFVKHTLQQFSKLCFMGKVVLKVPEFSWTWQNEFFIYLFCSRMPKNRNNTRNIYQISLLPFPVTLTEFLKDLRNRCFKYKVSISRGLTETVTRVWKSEPCVSCTSCWPCASIHMCNDSVIWFFFFFPLV